MSVLRISGPVLRRCAALGATSLLPVFFSGCAHTYRVRVDALVNPDVPAGLTYHLVPKDDVKADFDLNFAHALQVIETALDARGLQRTDSARDADMIVEVDYGVGSQRRSVSEDLDFFPGWRTRTPAQAAAATPVQAASNQPLAAPLPTAEPEPVPATRVSVVTMYEKYLTLSARETSRATFGLRAPVELWRVRAAVEDESTNAADCLAVLARTAAERIGTSTTEKQIVRVSDRSVLLANVER